MEISGVVVHGRALGRTLGFPTANISLSDRYFGEFGVFLAEVLVADKRYNGVLSIGRNETVRSGGAVVAECYILDFSSDIYGQDITFRVKSKLREQQKFPSIEMLKEQIARDVEMAKSMIEK